MAKQILHIRKRKKCATDFFRGCGWSICFTRRARAHEGRGEGGSGDLYSRNMERGIDLYRADGTIRTGTNDMVSLVCADNRSDWNPHDLSANGITEMTRGRAA